MEISSIPRKYLFGLIGVMILILATVVATNPGSFTFHNTTDYDAQKKVAAEETKQYEELLASVQPNYEASQQLLKKIATEDIVRKEVESTLDVNQKVTIPTIANSEIKITDRTDRAAMIDYVGKMQSMVSNYNND